MFLRQREKRKTASRLPFGLPSVSICEILHSVFGRVLRNVTERYRLSSNPTVQTAAELYRKQSFGRTSGYHCPAGGDGFSKSIRIYLYTYTRNIYMCAPREMKELVDWDREPSKGHLHPFVDAFPTGYGLLPFLSNFWLRWFRFIRVQDTLSFLPLSPEALCGNYLFRSSMRSFVFINYSLKTKKWKFGVFFICAKKSGK